MQKKYLLCPGNVKSKTDGDFHHISPVQLKNLYGVPMKECLILSRLTTVDQIENLIHLKPKYNGDYSLPKEEDE
jgi:hypothetical protein